MTVVWTVIAVFSLLLLVTATLQSGVAGFLMMAGLTAVLVGVAGFLTRGRTPGVSTRRSGGVTALVGVVAVVVAALMLPRPDTTPAVSTLTAEVAVDTSAQAAVASASSVAARSSAAAASVRASSSALAASSSSSSASAAAAASSAAASAAQVEVDRLAAAEAARVAAQAEADRVAAAAAAQLQAEKVQAEQAAAVEADRVAAVARAEADRVAAASAAARTTTQAAAAPPAPADTSGCDIKGNISSSGEKIYHVPGGGSYDVTKISESKGEKWFCSEADARAAGWRKAQN